MKSIKVTLAVILVTIMSASVNAQNHSQPSVATFSVKGKCGMCKARIEKAALINGVTSANWDAVAQSLTIVYDPSVVALDQVQKAVAAVGHDTEKFRADDNIYNALPGCCKYTRN